MTEVDSTSMLLSLRHTGTNADENPAAHEVKPCQDTLFFSFPQATLPCFSGAQGPQRSQDPCGQKQGISLLDTGIEGRLL